MAMMQLSGAMAVFLASASILGLPSDQDSEALARNTTYRLIFAFPAIFYLISVFLMFTAYTHDTIKYYLLTGQHDNAHEAIRQIYDLDSEEQAEKLAMNMEVLNSQVTIKTNLK
jgi:hypothetical protein